MKKEELIGAWKLITYQIFWKDTKKKIFPYGENGAGYLIYTPDDFVSVQIMTFKRAKCRTNNFRDLSPDEKIEIADHSGGYIGKYEFKNDCVIHYPEIASFPNFINTPQVRQIEFKYPILILKCPYSGKEFGNEGYSIIEWEKVHS